MSLPTSRVKHVIPHVEELIYGFIAFKAVGGVLYMGDIAKSTLKAGGATLKFAGRMTGLGSTAADAASSLVDSGSAVADLGSNMAGNIGTLQSAQGGLNAVGGAAENMAGPLSNAGDLVGNMSNQGSALQQGLGGAAPVMNSTSDAASNLGKSAKTGGSSLITMAGAALMIGAGIAVAALGLAKLVQSFNGLGSAAGPAALGIIGFTVAFGLMMVGLMALVAGPQAAFAAGAVGVLVAVGAAAMMIGGGMYLATAGVANMTNALSSLVSGGMNEQIAKLGTALENLGTSMTSSNLASEFGAIVSEMSRFENAITATGVANLQPFIAEMNDMANNAEQIKTTLTSARSTAIAANAANLGPQVMGAAIAMAMVPVVAAIAANANNQQPTGKSPNVNVHVELDGQKVSKNVEVRLDKKLISMVGLK
jgi:hypothetical protein